MQPQNTNHNEKPYQAPVNHFLQTLQELVQHIYHSLRTTEPAVIAVSIAQTLTLLQVLGAMGDTFDTYCEANLNPDDNTTLPFVAEHNLTPQQTLNAHWQFPGACYQNSTMRNTTHFFAYHAI